MFSGADIRSVSLGGNNNNNFHNNFPKNNSNHNNKENFENENQYMSMRSVASSGSVDAAPDAAVYPALLSQVARAFARRVPLGTHAQDMLSYADSFSGRDAVDAIAAIVRTRDRALCLLLGRALDAQRLFHDVTYTHRLRDSPAELYRFESYGSAADRGGAAAAAADRGSAPVTSSSPSDAAAAVCGVFTLLADCYAPTCSRDRLCYAITCLRRLELLAATSSRASAADQLPAATTSLSISSTNFASVAASSKDAATTTAASASATAAAAAAAARSQPTLWSTSVPKEVLESVTDREKTRQEVIFEIISSEREFVEDLESLIRVFLRPLRERPIINIERRERFVKEVFLNITELHAINSKLLRKLVARQKEQHVVDKVGDIFVNIADEFYPYVEYGSKQTFAKNTFDEEKASNPDLVKFLKDCERLPELRKLPLESFLARPTTRMGRYPLLLKPVMEKATENHPDRTLVPQALVSIRDVLSTINIEAGKAENVIKLVRLEKQLICSEGDREDLRLGEEGRSIVRDGKLSIKRAGNDIEMSVFLFDHMFLITRKKENGQYKIAKKPIPLELFVLRQERAVGAGGAGAVPGSGVLGAGGLAGMGSPGSTPIHRSSSVAHSPTVPAHDGLVHTAANTNAATAAAAAAAATVTSSMSLTTPNNPPGNSNLTVNPMLVRGSSQNGSFSASRSGSIVPRSAFGGGSISVGGGGVGGVSAVGSIIGGDGSSPKVFHINIMHLGRDGGQYTLFAATHADRIAWCEAIEKQKAALTERKKKFGVMNLISNAFPITNRVNCSVSCQDRLIIGSDNGLYVGPEHPVIGPDGVIEEGHFTRVIELERIMQVDVLPNYDMLLVLADKTLLSFPLQVLDLTEMEASSVSRKGKKIGSGVSFFKQGVCADRTLVCAVKSTALTATIKVLEPVGLGVSNLRGKLGKLFRATHDSLRVYKEFYIPTESRSIHYLKTKLCVGCAKGFEIVDLETLNTQGLLDPSDETLEFALKKDTVRPISIFRIRDGDFFLCYSEFGFYVDRFGRRARNDWLVHWAGAPTTFAYMPPYIIAFEPSFIEVRHVDTGELQQILPTANLKALNANYDALHCVSDLPTDYQQIFRLRPCDA